MDVIPKRMVQSMPNGVLKQVFRTKWRNCCGAFEQVGPWWFPDVLLGPLKALVVARREVAAHPGLLRFSPDLTLVVQWLDSLTDAIMTSTL